MNDDKLTPQARKERAKRGIAEAVADLIAATIEEGLAVSEWVDQCTSPLGRRRHLEIARTGKLASRKHGSRVLIRRDELNAYIEKEGLGRGKHTEEQDLGAVVDSLLLAGGSKRR